jgi:hypothetical protein
MRRERFWVGMIALTGALTFICAVGAACQQQDNTGTTPAGNPYTVGVCVHEDGKPCSHG